MAQISNLPGRINLKISGIGSLIYPGAGTGIEYILKQKEASDQEARRYETRTFIAGNLYFYHHPSFHDNMYFTFEWGRKRIKNNGFGYGFDLGTGLSRTFTSGNTYRVDDLSNVSKISWAGYYYAVITSGAEAEYDFSAKMLPFSVMAKMNLLYMFPYNSTLYIRPVLELGVKIHLKKLNAAQ